MARLCLLRAHRGDLVNNRKLVIVATIVAMSVLACSSTGSSVGPTRAAGATQKPATETPAATASSTPAGAPAASHETAEGVLARFAAEARKADERLRHAAALINAGIGEDTVRVDQATADAVRAAAPDAAARAVPLGLDHELLQRTLAVYNDLAARHAAMGYFRSAPRTYPMVGEGELMLECLGRGAPAAARFAADLAALENLARTRPAPAPTTFQPENEAELAVRLSRIDMRNGCADECGAYVYTTLEPLTWTHTPTATAAGRGELEGITFTVTPQDRGWAVSHNAC
jgi:hypothetical protein